MIKEQEWMKYIVTKDVDGFPIPVGFKKGTPKKIKKAYIDYQKVFNELKSDGYEF